MNYKFTLGEYLRYKRTVADMSLPDVSKLTGIPSGSLAYVERGERKLFEKWIPLLVEHIPNLSLPVIRILMALDEGKLELPVSRDSPPALLTFLEFMCTESIDWSNLDPEDVRQSLLKIVRQSREA